MKPYQKNPKSTFINSADSKEMFDNVNENLLSEDVEPPDSFDDLGLDLDDDKNDNLGFDDDLSFGMGDNFQPPAMEKHADLLKSLTNFDNFIKDMIRDWMNLIWEESKDGKAGRYVPDKETEPRVNKTFVKWAISELKIYTRDNNIITHIDKKDYETLMMDVIDVIWMNIYTRDEEFGIKNSGDLQSISIQMYHAIKLVLMGAGDGKYNKLLTETTNRQETLNNATTQGNNRPNGWVDQARKFFVGGSQ